MRPARPAGPLAHVPRGEGPAFSRFGMGRRESGEIRVGVRSYAWCASYGGFSTCAKASSTAAPDTLPGRLVSDAADEPMPNARAMSTRGWPVRAQTASAVRQASVIAGRRSREPRTQESKAAMPTGSEANAQRSRPRKASNGAGAGASPR